MFSFLYNLISTLLIASFFQPSGILRYPFHSSNDMSNDTGPSGSILTSWLHSHLGSIYGTAQPEEEDFMTLFHATFTESAVIRHNHDIVSQEVFLERLRVANFACTQATVEWDERLIVIPAAGDRKVCKPLLLLSMSNLYLYPGRNNSWGLRCHSLAQIPDSSGPSSKTKFKQFQRKVGNNFLNVEKEELNDFQKS